MPKSQQTNPKYGRTNSKSVPFRPFPWREGEEKKENEKKRETYIHLADQLKHIHSKKGFENICSALGVVRRYASHPLGLLAISTIKNSTLSRHTIRDHVYFGGFHCSLFWCLPCVTTLAEVLQRSLQKETSKYKMNIHATTFRCKF